MEVAGDICEEMQNHTPGHSYMYRRFLLLSTSKNTYWKNLSENLRMKKNLVYDFTTLTVLKKKTTFQSLFLCCTNFYTNFYTVLKTTQLYPSSIHLVSHVMHLSFPIVTCLFFTMHCLLASWVSLPIIIFHFLSPITLLSVVHVSIMSRGNEIFFPEKNDFFLKERNSSFSFNLLVPKLINNLR